MATTFVTNDAGRQIPFLDFDDGVGVLLAQIEDVFGPEPYKVKSYLVARLEAAKGTYQSGDQKAALGEAATVGWFLQDMIEIRGKQRAAFGALRATLRQVGDPDGAFPGMRQEVRRTAFFCQHSVDFEKRERPDFSVRLDGGDDVVGVECTSCTLTKALTGGKSDVLYKVRRAISRKSADAVGYADLPLILEIDINSLMYRVGSAGASTVLGGTQTHEAVRPSVDASPFQCVVLCAYITDEIRTPLGIQISPRHMYWRVDRSAPLSDACRDYLTKYFSNESTTTIHGRVFKLV